MSDWLNDYKYGNILGNVNASRVGYPENSREYQAIRWIGTNALPSLLEMLMADDGVRSWVNGAYPSLGSRKTTGSQKPALALLGFRILGPVAQPATGKLTELLKDKSPDLRILAAMALEELALELKLLVYNCPSRFLIRHLKLETQPQVLLAK